MFGVLWRWLMGRAAGAQPISGLTRELAQQAASVRVVAQVAAIYATMKEATAPAPVADAPALDDQQAIGPSALQLEVDQLLADAETAATTLASVTPDTLPATEAQALRALVSASTAASAHLRRLRASQPDVRIRPVTRRAAPVPQPHLRSAPGWRDKPRPVAHRHAAAAPRAAPPVRVACLMPRAA